MTKLTTERLDEIANIKITEFSDGTDTANGAYQSVGSSEIVLMARQLLAYEQAAEHPAARITWDGSEFSVSNVSEDFLYGGTAVYLAPVLPKQPEHHATKLDLATIKLWNWNAKITMGETEENCEEWIAARAILSLSDDLLALLAQPVQEMTYMMATERGIKTSNRDQWVKGYNAAINDGMLLSPAQPVSEHKPSYRDGLISAAQWVEKQREAYDNEHGRHDSDTGFFEFGNDSQRDYSETLAEIAEGIRALHPASAQLVSEPYKLNGWISVDEKMPEGGVAVLVHQKGGIIFCAEVESGEFYPDEFPNLPRQGCEITHWMPLPDAQAQGGE